MRRHQRRQVAEHPLQAHVLRLARRLHLAGVVIVQHAARQARHRDRRVQPFADVDDRRPGRAAWPRSGRTRRACPAPAGTLRDQQAGGDRGDAMSARARELEPVRRSSGTPVGSSMSKPGQRRRRRSAPAARAGCRATRPAAGSRRSEPTIAPTRVRGVDAADEPRRDPGRASATDASASGKLAPHRIAPGSTTQRQRTRSSWNVEPRARSEIDGLIGQYGSDCVEHRTPPRRWPRTAAAGTSRARRAGRASCARAPSRRCCRCRGRQKHRQDQREGVDRRAEQQRQQPRPDHLGRRARSCPTARWRRRRAQRRRRDARAGHVGSRDRCGVVAAAADAQSASASAATITLSATATYVAIAMS